MIDYIYPKDKYSRLFRNEKLDNLFYELLYLSNEGEFKRKRGALSYILLEYPTKLAKGGKKFSNYEDTSYFAHVFNSTFIAAKLFELSFNDVQIDTYIEKGLMRLFLCSMVLHDMNKLISGSNDGLSYYNLLINKKQELIKIVSYNMSKETIYSTSEEWIEDLIFLILSVEDETRKFASNLQTTIEKPVLMKMSRFLHLGDKYSSKLSIKGFDSDLLVDEINRDEEIKLLIENEKYTALKVNLNVIPQSMIYQEARTHIKKAIKDCENCEIFLSSYNWFLILIKGKERNRIEFKKQIMEKALDRLRKGPNEEISKYENKIKNLKHLPNGINISFMEQGFFSAEAIRYCAKYWSLNNPGSSYLHFQGKDWIKNNFDKILSKLKPFGISSDVKNVAKFIIQPSADGRCLFVEVWILILLRTEVEPKSSKKNDWISIKNFLDIDEDSMSPITRKTVDTMLKAIEKVDNKSEEEIEKIIMDLSEEISNLAKLDKSRFKAHNDPMAEAIEKMLKSIINNDEERTFDREHKCIQCGSKGASDFEDSKVFGIKATSGTGIKLSSLNDTPRFKGKICNLCLEENLLRRGKYGDLDGSWVIQLSPFEILPEMDYSKLITLYDHFQSSNLKKPIIEDKDDTMSIKIGQGTSILIGDSHIIGFINKSSSGGSLKVDKAKSLLNTFYIIDASVSLIKKLGIKISISPLFSTDQTNEATFFWENAPAWIQKINLNKLHLDEIENAYNQINLLKDLSLEYKKNMNGFMKEILIKAIRNPLYLYSIISNSIFEDKKNSEKEKFDKRIEFKADLAREKFNKGIEFSNRIRNCMMMEEKIGEIIMMDEVVRKASELYGLKKFLKYKEDIPASNNDREWIIRKSFRIEEKLCASGIVEDGEIISGIACEIDKGIRRDNSFKYVSDHDIAEKVLGYSQEFHKFYKEIAKEKAVDSELRKIFINQFGFLLYLKIYGMYMRQKEEPSTPDISATKGGN